MSEYIEKDKILKFKQDVYDADGHLLYAIPTGCVIAMKSADVAPVRHGRWEDGPLNGYLHCSVCKDVYIDDTWLDDGKWNYCPNCGAKMDLEET